MTVGGASGLVDYVEPAEGSRRDSEHGSSVTVADEARPTGSRLPRRALLLLIVPILVGITGVVGNAFMPALINDHPLLLLALNARPRNLILAIHVPFVPWFLLGLFRAFVTDPFVYVLGRDYGSLAVDFMERRVAFMARGYRWLERVYQKGSVPLVLLVPGPGVCLLAGASGMPPKRFYTLNLVGTATSLVMYRFFGDYFSTYVEIVLGFIGEHRALLTTISVVLVVGGLGVRAYRMRRKARQVAKGATADRPG